MMDSKQILDRVKQKKLEGKKSFAILIDPDKNQDHSGIINLVNLAVANQVDFIFVGGSLITNDSFSDIITTIKDYSNIPVVIFPGNQLQIDPAADAILLLSLISGRNPDLLIGQHVLAAPVLKRSKLEIIPTGYLLVSSGAQTSASYMSNTTPIPSNKPAIAACTAMAGEMLGMQIIYLDAGSGSETPISQKVISTVRRSVSIPIIVGGGINSAVKAQNALESGADLIVLGNGIEKNPNLLVQVARKVQSYKSNSTLDIH